MDWDWDMFGRWPDMKQNQPEFVDDDVPILCVPGYCSSDYGRKAGACVGGCKISLMVAVIILRHYFRHEKCILLRAIM